MTIDTVEQLDEMRAIALYDKEWRRNSKGGFYDDAFAMCMKYARAIRAADDAAGLVTMPAAIGQCIKVNGEPVHELRGPVNEVYAAFVSASPFRKG